MNTTLLLLWSLASLSLQDTSCACQGGPGGMGPGAAGYGFSDPNSAPGASVGLSGQFGMSDGYGDMNSPCRDCRGGRGGRGGCKNCCKDSTCNMYQHFPYQPDNHGYYYFRPYNYTAVWQHQQWIATIGGDPRNPYSHSVFIPVYEQFENTTYEPDSKPSQTLQVLPHVSKELPDLEKLLKKSDEDMPPATDAVPEPPAPGATNS